MVSIGNEWDALLADEFQKPYYQALRQFLMREYSTQIIYPDKHDIFNALRYTSQPSGNCKPIPKLWQNHDSIPTLRKNPGKYYAKSAPYGIP